MLEKHMRWTEKEVLFVNRMTSRFGPGGEGRTRSRSRSRIVLERVSSCVGNLRYMCRC